MTWKAIPEDHVHGIIRCYVVQMDDTHTETFSCPNNFNTVITDLEKSKVYKLRMAAYTSRGPGNFSEYVTVITNIDGRLFGRGRVLGIRLLSMHYHRFYINVLCHEDRLIECGVIIKKTLALIIQLKRSELFSCPHRQCVTT